MNRSLNPRFRRRALTRSSRVQVFAPPPVPTERYATRLVRVIIAGRQHHQLGRGQLLKQTFPPPVQENVLQRIMRVVTAPRRRWQAPSSRTQVFAPPPPTENFFTRVLRVVRAGRRRWQSPTSRTQVLTPPPSPTPFGDLFIFLRMAVHPVGHHDKRRVPRSKYLGRGFLTGPLPSPPAALKRIAGWFRNFWRIG